jgi:DNA-binding SARP family transcriptional activator
LGNFCMKYDDTPVTDIDTPRLQSLVAYLILHRDAPQTRARLAFIFWPDTSEAQARTNLRNLLHHLRRALPDANSLLDFHGQTLLWKSNEPLFLDVDIFYRDLAYAEQSLQLNNVSAAKEALESAVNLCKGDLLPSCYDDWILPLRERLHQSLINAIDTLVDIYEEECNYPAAIQNAQRLLRYDPIDV